MSWLQWISVDLTVNENAPLWPQIQSALAGHGEPLRWAITKATTTDGVRHLTIEAIMVRPAVSA